MCERFHMIGSRANVRLQAHLAASLAPCLMIDTCSNCAARYAVQGEIVNTGQASGSARTLKLTFKKDNDVLGERSYALAEGQIAPGARLGFRQTLDDPPEGTTDIVPAVE